MMKKTLILALISSVTSVVTSTAVVSCAKKTPSVGVARSAISNETLTVTPTTIAMLDRMTTGGHPRAGLVLAPDGRLYGTSWQNGPNDGGDTAHSCSSNFYWGIGTPSGDPSVQKNECPGAIYSLKIDGTDIRLEHAFSKIDATLGRNDDGYQPVADLTVGVDGWLYGTTSLGGRPTSGPTIKGCGVAFKFKPGESVSTWTVLHSFCSMSQFKDGSIPYGGLVHAGSGQAYGAAKAGGVGGSGVIYRIDLTTGAVTSLYSFPALDRTVTPAVNATGASPYSSPTLAPNGKLYGMTVWGGTSGNGAIYAFSPSTGAIEVVYTFPMFVWSGNRDNAPQQMLTVASNGMLYGTNVYGGSNGSGLIFKINRAGDYVQLHEFGPRGELATPRFSNTDGSQPLSSLTEDQDHRLWGTTFYGGSQGLGSVYYLGCDDSFNVVGSFVAAPAPNRAYSTFVRVGDKMIGTTYAGGTTGFGTVYSVETQ